MKKFLLSFAVIASFIAYALHERSEDGDENVAVVPPSSTTIQTTPTPASSATNLKREIEEDDDDEDKQVIAPKVTATPNPVNLGQYKNGEYTGDVTDAYYGNVQVKAIIENGKIADVKFLQYPNDRRTSERINSQAMPYLTQEAIQSQSSEVDIISGATQTSKAFRQSLQSALDKART